MVIFMEKNQENNLFLPNGKNKVILILEYENVKIKVYEHWLKEWYDLAIITDELQEYISIRNKEEAIKIALKKFSIITKI